MKDGELFDIHEQLSPRERWRRAFVLEFGVEVRFNPDARSRPWHAYTGTWRDHYNDFEVPGDETKLRYAQHARAQTAEAALEWLAIKFQHPLCGEQR